MFSFIKENILKQMKNVDNIPKPLWYNGHNIKVKFVVINSNNIKLEICQPIPEYWGSKTQDQIKPNINKKIIEQCKTTLKELLLQKDKIINSQLN